MKVSIIKKIGKYQPVIFCDVCQKTITSTQIRLAMYKWDKPSDEVRVCHAGCDDNSLGSQTSGWAWNPLSDLLKKIGSLAKK